MGDMANVSTVFLVLIVYGVILSLVSIFSGLQYILTSIGLYVMAKNRGIKAPILAWIPIGNVWIIGSLADFFDSLEGKNKNWKKVLMTLALITLGLFALFLLIYFSVFVVVFGVMDSGAPQGIFVVMMVILAIALYGVLILGTVMATTHSMVLIICVYKIYEAMVPERSVKYLLISLLVPAGQGFCLFACRKNTAGIPPAPVVDAFEPDSF